MRLIDAMTLRDGGTSGITVSQGIFARVSYTIDYSLPHDGRKRFLFRGQRFTKDEAGRMEIGCDEEARIREWLINATTRKFGATVVKSFLDGQAQNPGEGNWFYALNFCVYFIRKETDPRLR